METILATGGYLVPPEGYFASMRHLCGMRGALLILDGVQAGLGRTGRLWALEHFGVVPDMLVTGKGTSAGVCCFGDRVEAHFAEDPFFHPSSYAGSELGARVIAAVVERYEGTHSCCATSAIWAPGCGPGWRPSRSATPTASPRCAA